MRWRPLPSRDWHLTCAGSLTRHPPTVARIRAIIQERQLEEHVSLVGELDAEQIEERYDRADVFVLATLRETYGMAVAEALAHGLPVVSTSTGAIPVLVGTEAGLARLAGRRAGFVHRAFACDRRCRLFVRAWRQARVASGRLCRVGIRQSTNSRPPWSR